MVGARDCAAHKSDNNGNPSKVLLGRLVMALSDSELRKKVSSKIISKKKARNIKKKREKRRK